MRRQIVEIKRFLSSYFQTHMFDQDIDMDELNMILSHLFPFPVRGVHNDIPLSSTQYFQFFIQPTAEQQFICLDVTICNSGEFKNESLLNTFKYGKKG